MSEEAFGEERERGVTVAPLAPSKSTNNNKVSDLTQSLAALSLSGKINPDYYHSIVRIVSHETQFDYSYPFKIRGDEESSGTGFFIDNQGHVLTCAHVVEGASRVYVQIPSIGKQEYEAVTLGVCPFFDLALIRIKSLNPPRRGKDIWYRSKNFCKLHNAATYRSRRRGDEWVKSGDETYALGFPLGQTNLKVTKGIISGQQFRTYQIDTPINPGNSGGPLIKGDHVIGVNSAGMMFSNNIGYAVPISRYFLIKDQLHKPQNIIHYPEVFGFEYQRTSDEFQRFLGIEATKSSGGVYIKRIFKNSPVSKTGLKAGDILFRLNGIEIDQYGEFDKRWMNQKMTFENILATIPLGQKVPIQYWDGKKRTVCETTFEMQSYKMPIRTRYPVFESIEYAVVAGLVIVPVTLNHLRHGSVFGRSRKYKRTEHRHEPRLIVPTILSGSYAASTKIVKKNETIAEVNGKPTHTIDQLRKHILQCVTPKEQSGGEPHITILTEERNYLVIPVSRILEDEARLQKDYKYPEDKSTRELRDIVKRSSHKKAAPHHVGTQRRRRSLAEPNGSKKKK